MTVLLLNQFFWPDSAPTSQLLTDLAQGLKERGNEVHVVCAQGEYAVKDQSNDPHVNVHRIKAAPFVRNRLGRALTYGSFLFACAFRSLFLPKPDLIVTLTTPPLLSLLGTMLKAIRGSRHIIWEMDVYPDVAADLNYIRQDGLLYKLSGALADKSREYADVILALGDCMKKRLVARGVPEAKVQVTQNWADGQLIYPLARRPAGNAMVILYSGNLGLAHDTETIVGAMDLLRADERFRFVFAGGGPSRGELEVRCRQLGISQAEFRAYGQRQRLGQILGSCDIGLITQRASCLGSVVPSKIYGLLAAGRPVIFIGPRESTVAVILRRFKCGWHVANGDVADLVRLLSFLAARPAEIEIAGRRARKAFEENFDLPFGVARICSVIESFEKEKQAEVLVASGGAL